MREHSGSLSDFVAVAASSFWPRAAVSGAVILDGCQVSSGGQPGAISAGASALGVELIPVGVTDPGEIERELTVFARQPNGGIVVSTSALAQIRRDVIISLQLDIDCRRFIRTGFSSAMEA